MRARLSDQARRQRIEALTRGLRRFGLVDQFGLGALVLRPGQPSEAAIAARLRNYEELLPRSVPIAFIAQSILIDLRGLPEDEDNTGTQLIRTADLAESLLKKIPVGKSGAARYHDFMVEWLPWVFEDSLRFSKKELKVGGGIKYIDIVFANDAQEGFFSDLVNTFKVRSPFIVAECKNYVEDPGAPEFDQLAGRLNDKAGRFGLLICRSVKDKDRAIAYCRHALSSNGNYLLTLSDDDIMSLIRARQELDAEALREPLERKFRDLLFA